MSDHEALLAPPNGEINNSGSTVNNTAYTRRWYILLVFSLHCVLQNLIWNTWSPIQNSCIEALGWTTADIALLMNWGPIMYIVATPLATWLLDTKGLRVSCVINILLMWAGSGLRCITLARPAADILIHSGHILNGLAGPIVMATPPLVSATWFPVQQRNLATAIGWVGSGLGTSFSFIIGPLIVPEYKATNSCVSSVASLESYNFTNCTSDNKETILDRTRLLLFIEFGLSCVILLATLAYFPARPPSPPSVTAAKTRMSYIDGIKTLMYNKKFWILAFVYPVSTGIYFCWIGLLDVNIQPFGFSEKFAGWLGFAGSMAGNVSPVIFALIVDLFARRHTKTLVIVQYIISTLCFIVLALSMAGVFPLTAVLLYATVIGASVVITAAIPMFFEMVCEISYPVSEGVTNGLLTCCSNLASLTFLCFLLIKPLGTAWMTWATTGAILVCVPVLFFINTEHRRLDIDTGVTSEILQ